MLTDAVVAVNTGTIVNVCLTVCAGESRVAFTSVATSRLRLQLTGGAVLAWKRHTFTQCRGAIHTHEAISADAFIIRID